MTDELVYYLQLIESLPPIPEWYLPESEEVQAELNKLRANWKGQAAWLRHMLLGEPEPNYGEDSSLLGDYPGALLSAHFRDLTAAIRQRSPLLQSLGTANRVWFNCEVSDSLREYESSGLRSLIESGQAQPQLRGKRSLLDENSRHLWRMDIYRRVPEECLGFVPLESNDQLRLSYRNFILGQAYLIAKSDPIFRDQVLANYNAVAEKVNGLWRKAGTYQTTAILPDGSRFTGGKSRNRGFGKHKN